MNKPYKRDENIYIYIYMYTIYSLWNRILKTVQNHQRIHKRRFECIQSNQILCRHIIGYIIQ